MKPMTSRVRSATLFALYQFTIVLGIVAMPIAMAARRAGLSVPIHRLIASVGTAYENVNASAS